MSQEYNVPVNYISKGQVIITADSYGEAVLKAERIVANGHQTGSILSPSYEKHIMWEGAEATVDGEDIDLDDMKYFEEED